ncbi:hypothetical protein HDV64DRAFT_49007 [Trichoderma sp. TUCIM 5745]
MVLYGSLSACNPIPNAWRCLSSKGRLPFFNENATEEDTNHQVSSTEDLMISSCETIILQVFDEGEKDKRFLFSFEINTTVGAGYHFGQSCRKAHLHRYDFFSSHFLDKAGVTIAKQHSSKMIEWTGQGWCKSWKLRTRYWELDQMGRNLREVQLLMSRAKRGACERLYRTKGWI